MSKKLLGLNWLVFSGILLSFTGCFTSGSSDNPDLRQQVTGLMVQRAPNVSEAQNLLLSDAGIIPNITPEAPSTEQSPQRIYFTAESVVVHNVGSILETRTSRTVQQYLWDLDNDNQYDYVTVTAGASISAFNNQAPSDWTNGRFDCEMVSGVASQIACNAPGKEKQYKAAVTFVFDFAPDIASGLCDIVEGSQKSCGTATEKVTRDYTLLSPVVPTTSPTQNVFNASMRTTEHCLDSDNVIRETNTENCDPQSNFTAGARMGVKIRYDGTSRMPVNPSYEIAGGNGDFVPCDEAHACRNSSGFFTLTAPAAVGEHTIQIRITEHDPDVSGSNATAIMEADYTVGEQAVADFTYSHSDTSIPGDTAYTQDEVVFINPESSFPSDRRYGEIVQYRWGFNGQTPVCNYPPPQGGNPEGCLPNKRFMIANPGAPGIYLVSLTIEDNLGQTATVTKSYVVRSATVPELDANLTVLTNGCVIGDPSFSTCSQMDPFLCNDGQPTAAACGGRAFALSAQTGSALNHIQEGSSVLLSVTGMAHNPVQANDPIIARSIWRINGEEIRCEAFEDNANANPANCIRDNFFGYTKIRYNLPLIENNLAQRPIGITVELTDSLGAQTEVSQLIQIERAGFLMFNHLDDSDSSAVYQPGEPIEVAFRGPDAYVPTTSADWTLTNEDGQVISTQHTPEDHNFYRNAGIDTTQNLYIQATGVYGSGATATYRTVRHQIQIRRDFDLVLRDCEAEAGQSTPEPENGPSFCNTVTLGYNPGDRFTAFATQAFEQGNSGIRRIEWFISENPQRTYTCAANGSQNPSECSDFANEHIRLNADVPASSGFFEIRALLTEMNGTQYERLVSSSVRSLNTTGGMTTGGNTTGDETTGDSGTAGETTGGTTDGTGTTGSTTGDETTGDSTAGDTTTSGGTGTTAGTTTTGTTDGSGTGTTTGGTTGGHSYVSDPGVNAQFTTHLWTSSCEYMEQYYSGGGCAAQTTFRDSNDFIGYDVRNSSSVHGAITEYALDLDDDGTFETCNNTYGESVPCGYWRTGGQELPGRYRARAQRAMGPHTVWLRVTDSEGHHGYASQQVCTGLCDLTHRFYDYGPSERVLMSSELTDERMSVADSGLTECTNSIYGVADYSTTCPSQVYPGQDAQFGRDTTSTDSSDGHASFSFTKYRYENGTRTEVPYSTAFNAATHDTWDCVQDRNTGLYWEVKTNDGGTFDASNLFGWYEPQASRLNTRVGAANPTAWQGSAVSPYGSCGNDLENCNSNEYINAVNAANRCGFNDWRLPTIQEWFAITNFQSPNTEAIVSPLVMPHLYRGPHWSSTVTFMGNYNYSYVMNIDTTDGTLGYGDTRLVSRIVLVRGGTVPQVSASTNPTGQAKNRYPEFTGTDTTYPRCWRDIAGETAPRERFLENNDGTVTDVSTGLMWSQCLAGQTVTGSICSGNYDDRDPYQNQNLAYRESSWRRALDYADQSTLAGHSDWRVPSIKELQSIMEYSCRSYKLNSDIFPPSAPEANAQGMTLWSSTYNAHSAPGQAYRNSSVWVMQMLEASTFPAGFVGATPANEVRRPFYMVRTAR